MLLVPGVPFAEYPEIRRLDTTDLLFRQITRDIETYYRISAAGGAEEGMPALSLFRYRLRGIDDLLSVSARLNLPYETIATVNDLSNMEEMAELGEILVPNLPGIFVPVEPRSELQTLMQSWREDPGASVLSVRSEGSVRDYRFFLGDRFHPVERAYFLRILFRFPLAGGIVTSGYGMRKDPLGDHPQFHNGIDIGAASGTPVVAAREGTVDQVGFDEIYGNFVLVSHVGGYQSLYGHLSEVLVSLKETVNSGSIIGKVGSTGRSTGPHLHFEIRKKGSSRDPIPLLPLEVEDDV